MNFLRAKVEEEKQMYLRIGPERFEITLPALQYLLRKQCTSECVVGIRPEYVLVSPTRREGCSIEGSCIFVEFIGGREIFHIRIGEEIEIRAKAFPREDIQEGQRVFVGFPDDKIRIFSLDGIVLRD